MPYDTDDQPRPNDHNPPDRRDDSRLTALEVRMEHYSNNLQLMERDIRETKTNVQSVLTKLTDYMLREEENRQKLLFGVLVALISVVGAFVFEYYKSHP